MSPLAPVLAQELEAAVAARAAPVPFAEFMQIVLYHPQEGYYSRKQERVGFGGATDFFTAAATGAVFSELVIEACTQLLAPAPPADVSFVEIGAEPGGGVLPMQHPFKESRLLRRDDALEIPRSAVVFSNELFDAQPFHRLVFQEGVWREIGIDWIEGQLTESLLPEFSPPVTQIADRLPRTSAEGYHLDLPLAAASLLERIVTASAWHGPLVIFDYGKTWRELSEATPQGTARAYRRHRQSNDLLANPGHQDLTCHICWDWLETILAGHGFTDIALQSQEAFLVTRAAPAIERIVTARPGQLDPRRQTLQQILHPANMGQKFQVLSARR